MTATTFRSDVVGAIYTVLLAQKTATPTQLRAVYRRRPGSFPDTPAAYVSGVGERITYSGQLRTRTLSGFSVVLVDTLFADPLESGDRMDDLVDLLVERFTAAYATIPGGGSIVALTSAVDTEVDVVGANGQSIIYRGCILGFDDSFITEGRS